MSSPKISKLPSSGIPNKKSLLAPDEAPALEVVCEQGASDIVLTCDHASRDIPRALGTLGLSETERNRHTAWDIGAADVARRLAERLDATLVLQRYSRLVIDCNRPLRTPESIPLVGEWAPIPGNEGLSEDEVTARIDEVFQPYHDGLRQILDLRRYSGRSTLLVAMHSFTPSYRGQARPWHIGVMYHHDARLATALLKLLNRDKRLVVGDNEPYAVEDATDYTIPIHGEARRLPHVGIEIRQDLITDPAEQTTWAGRLATQLKQAAKEVAARES